MPIYKSVGWFARDPFDETTIPIAAVVSLKAEDRSAASARASELLAEMHPELELLNWYTRDTSGEVALSDEADCAIEAAALAAGWASTRKAAIS
jgi:hypothetical protein